MHRTLSRAMDNEIQLRQRWIISPLEFPGIPKNKTELAATQVFVLRDGRKVFALRHNPLSKFDVCYNLRGGLLPSEQFSETTLVVVVAETAENHAVNDFIEHEQRKLVRKS